jgi:hypothetical protein
MSDTEDYQKMATHALTRIQTFNPKSLERREDLGKSFEMSAAIEPAGKLVELFKLLPVGAISFFPNEELKAIEAVSSSNFKLLTEVLEFDPQTDPSANDTRNSLIEKIERAYQPAFTKLQPYISFSVARTADFQALAEEGRAAVQSVDDRVNSLMERIEKRADEMESVVQEARRSLAEKGVSQEAFHFQTQATNDGIAALRWHKVTLGWAISLAIFAAGSVFIHKIPFLTPVNSWEAAQLIVAKILCFGVIAFMLSLSARSYLSHRHNEVVNLHRQNALMTYRSLVEAGGTQEARDIILQQAAAAIYQLQDTGYVKSSERSNTTITELIPRTTMSLAGSNSP